MAETSKRFHYIKRQYAIHLLYCVLFLFLGACAPAITATPFVAPRGERFTSTPGVAQVIPATTPTSTPAPQPSPTSLPTDLPLPSPQATVTPQQPPTAEPTQPQPTIDPGSPTPKTCLDSLHFLDDLTYKDYTPVTPGQAIQKQWSVQNNGTCDWDANYRLKLFEGYPSLGSTGEQALYPARAGSQATLTINFIAPQESGTYQTAWQAVNPQGEIFGEIIFMVIVVQ